MKSSRLNLLIAVAMQAAFAAGLSKAAFERLPVFGLPARRKTVDHYFRLRQKARHSGDTLRAIRATGQIRECARRRARFMAAAA